MNENLFVFLVIIGVIGLLVVGVYLLSTWTDDIHKEKIAEIDKNFKCKEAYIFYLEAEYKVVREHIITKVFKECLT